MYDELELLLILIAAAVGIGIIGGTFLHDRRGLALFDRYGCLLPGLGLGAGGLVVAVVGLLYFDRDISPTGALLVGGVSIASGLVASYGFSKNDFGLGTSARYGLGVGSLLLSGGLAFGLAGPGSGPGPQPAPTSTAATPSATAAATATMTASPSATEADTASPTVAPSPTATSGGTTTSPTTAIGQRTDFFDALIQLGALEEGRVDDYMDDYQTDPEGDHSHASGGTPGFTPPFVDIRGHVGFSWTIDNETADLLNGVYPCTRQGRAPFSVQCMGSMPIAAGDWVFVNVMADGMLPSSFSGSALATLSVVFDDDGDPESGYQPDPAFPGDSFQGSTRWYEQFWLGTTSQCFATDATLLNDDGVPERNNATSEGRFITWHSNSMGVAEYVLMVPASEVGSYYRAVIIGTQDATTYAPAVTSHDYTEADGPFSFHMLESY